MFALRTISVLLLALTVSTGAVFAQGRPPVALSRGTVTGLVLDEEDGSPLPSATVALLQGSDSTLVTGAITTEDGSFRIENLRPGAYRVRVSFVGFEPVTLAELQLSRTSPVADLGPIRLRSTSAELDEVTVSAQREYLEIRADRTVYNTREQPMTAGGSAQNVLETIPSIEVDFDGTISLRGNQNVVIYLNGKPAPMTGQALTSFLQGLSAEAIERVEIIPNPSARYEPEGMAGIVNIVLSRDRGGQWGGGVNATASTNEAYGGSVNGHYTDGPWGIYATYSFRDRQRIASGYRLRENRLAEPRTFLEQESTSESSGLSHNLNTSVDYRLSDANTLSLSAMLSDRAQDGLDEDASVGFDENDLVLERYVNRNEDERSDFGMDYRIRFRRETSREAPSLSAEARYERDVEDETESRTLTLLDTQMRPLPDGIAEEQHVLQDEIASELSAQIDYVRPLGDHLTSETGYRSSLELIDSDLYSEMRTPASGAFLPDLDLNNAFAYEQQIHAAYGMISGGTGGLEAQIGLRAEAVATAFDLLTTAETFDHDYVSLYPSVHVSFGPTEARTYRVSYSKRVRRPRTWQLNPFGDFSDPTFRRVGNPALDPEYTHSLELGVTQLGNAYTVSLTPYYRHTVNEISWYEEITPEGVSILTFHNYDTSDSWGLELIGSLNFGDWMRGNGSFNAFKQVTEAGNLESGLSSDAIGWMSRLQTTFSITDGLELQVSRFYRAPHEVPGGHRGSFSMTNLALSQKMLDGRGQLSLRASDPFDQMGFQMQRDTDRFAQTFRRSWDARSVQVSFRYSFGQQERRRRDRGQERGGEEIESGYGDM